MWSAVAMLQCVSRTVPGSAKHVPVRCAQRRLVTPCMPWRRAQAAKPMAGCSAEGQLRYRCTALAPPGLQAPQVQAAHLSQGVVL